ALPILGRFIVRIGPPDFPPGDAYGERRPQRDAGREVRARLGMALAERRREVQGSGVVAPTETDGDPPARGPRLSPGGDVFRCGTDLAHASDAVGWRGIARRVGLE